MFEQVLTAIREYDRIIIHRHSRPDGDALGSQIGLKHIISDNFPHKTVYIVGDDPRSYSWIDGAVMDDVADELYAGALAIVLDCGSAHLISDERWSTAAKTVRIDHHLFCGPIGEIDVVDSSFESCCGLITEFARESGLALSPASAGALYTGMVTDSGRFRYDSTNARTLRLAALLLEQGIDTNELYRRLYADDYAAKKLKAQYILKIQFTPHNVAWIYTTAGELAQTGRDSFSVSRGMVGTMSDTRGVDIWVNFTETEEGVLCELRSSRYNINPVAVKYGGGGHAKASGACVPDRETAMNMLADLDAMMTGEYV